MLSVVNKTTTTTTTTKQTNKKNKKKQNNKKQQQQKIAGESLFGTPTAVNDEQTSGNRSSSVESHDLSRDTLRTDHENRKPATYSQDSDLQFQNKIPVRIQGLRNEYEKVTSHQTQGSRDKFMVSTLADDIELSSYVRKRTERFYVWGFKPSITQENLFRMLKAGNW